MKFSSRLSAISLLIIGYARKTEKTEKLWQILEKMKWALARQPI